MKRLLLILAAAAATFGQAKINGSRTIEGPTNYCADTGSTDAYACSLAPAITAYQTGTRYTIKVNTNNTGAATLALNGLAAKDIKKFVGGASQNLATDDLRAGGYYDFVYDGTNMVVVSLLGNAGSGSGGLTLVEQHTASASASLDFTTCISATYDSYLIDLVDIVPATDSVKIGLRVSTDGGSSYVSTASYAWIGTAFSASAIGHNGSNSDTAIYFNNTLSNSTTEGSFNAKINLKNPANATAYKSFHGEAAGFNTADYVHWRNAGWYKSATAINAFQILSSSGNIASGTVRCYGLAK